MARRSSSSVDVLLGLLTIEPMSGYDMGQTIRSSVGHFWNESYGQIYPNLKRMEAAGLVTAETEKQPGKPDRRVYSITSKGRERLAEWLAVPPQAEIPRNELLLKIFFGAQASPQLLIDYVERMVEQERSALKHFEEIEQEIGRNQQYPDAPYWKIAARFGQIELDAHVRWARETLAELHQLSGKKENQKSRKEKRNAGK